jgi:hydroxymethylbilane synthase
MNADPLRIGTRGSALALWQARTVAAAIEAAGHPRPEIVVLKTTGDRLQEAPLSAAGGKRLFVKEIEDALLRGDVDIAVHSAKDMPADLPAGLAIGAVLAREDPRDAIVLRGRPEARDRRPEVRTNAGVSAPSASEAWQALGVGPQHNERNADWLATVAGAARIGTSSVRRAAQLRALLPNARFEPIRGNVDTRLRKLDAGELDALVLAGAGLRRLGFGDRVSALVPLDACVPAPGQGAIAVEIRADAARARDTVAALDDATTAAALDAERAVIQAIGGGCQLPLGAVATPIDEDRLELQAIVISLDGTRVLRESARGLARESRALGRRVGEALKKAGALEILYGVR